MRGETSSRVYCPNGKCPLNYMSGSFSWRKKYRCPSCGGRMSMTEGKKK